MQPPASLCGNPVREATVDSRLRLDQTVALEPRERPVQSPRPKREPGERLDVLDQRVPVLVSTSQAGQHQHASLRQSRSAAWHQLCTTSKEIVTRSSQVLGSARSPGASGRSDDYYVQ